MNKTELQKLIDEAPDDATIELRINGELVKPEKKPYELDIPKTDIYRSRGSVIQTFKYADDHSLYRTLYESGNTEATYEDAQRMQRWRKLNMLITSFIAKCNAELNWVADFGDKFQSKHYLVFNHKKRSIVVYCDLCYQYKDDIGVYFCKDVEQKIYAEFTPQQLSFWLTRIEGLL